MTYDHQWSLPLSRMELCQLKWTTSFTHTEIWINQIQDVNHIMKCSCRDSIFLSIFLTLPRTELIIECKPCITTPPLSLSLSHSLSRYLLDPYISSWVRDVAEADQHTGHKCLEFCLYKWMYCLHECVCGHVYIFAEDLCMCIVNAFECASACKWARKMCQHHVIVSGPLPVRGSDELYNSLTTQSLVENWFLPLPKYIICRQ